APLAALMSERDLLRGGTADLSLRIAALADPGRHGADRAAVARIRAEAVRLARDLPPPARALDLAEMAALAYPDRIGLRRPGEAARYLLTGGKGAIVAEGDPLGRSRTIVATDLDGDPREARVRQGIALDEAALRMLFAGDIGWRDLCEWSRRDGRVIARRQECLGALVLSERPWPDAPAGALARAALDGLRQTGLRWTTRAARLRDRIAFLHRAGAPLPDVSDAALLGRED